MPLLAGFASVEISASTPGAELIGYPKREGPALGVHDPLRARALVLDHAGTRVAICSLDLGAIGGDVVAAARERITSSSGIPGHQVFVSITHTHSGPSDIDAGCWPDGLDAEIDKAVAQACDRLQPARLGVGWGMLHGHAMNRRRFEDPIDPALIVIRIDDRGGRPLGLYYGLGCHPVVLGPDNRYVSGDWPSTCCEILESRMGAGTVAVFGQGACADVNPITAGVRARLAAGDAVRATSAERAYYGPFDQASWDRRISNRVGGTFDEAQRIGEAVAREALRVHSGIGPGPVARLWTQQMMVDQRAMPTTDRGDGDTSWPRSAVACTPVPRVTLGQPLEVMLVGIDGPDVLLIGQPGEVFADTGVSLRRDLRRAGIRNPFVVGYANDWWGYLPPSHAFIDGGYEVEWARAMELPETLQADIRKAVLDAIRTRSTR